MNTLLFLNGWAADASIWKPTLDHLDLAFQGQPARTLLEDWSIQYIDWLNIERSTDIPRLTAEAVQSSDQVIVVAWSTGTLAAIQAAHQFPDRISHMLLISPTAKFTTGTDRAYGWQVPLLEHLQRRICQVPASTLRAFYQKCDPNLSDQAAAQLIQALAPITRKRKTALTAGLQYLIDTDSRRTLSALQCKVSLFTGLDDEICEPEMARHMAHAIPASQLYEIMDGAHLLPMTHGREIATELADILKQLEDPHD